MPANLEPDAPRGAARKRKRLIAAALAGLLAVLASLGVLPHALVAPLQEAGALIE